MDLANLSAFATIAESGSFSVAAEALSLTQPAVSKRIALLEGSCPRSFSIGTVARWC